MSNLIIDPSDSPIQAPPDGFWDKPVTRRAFQAQLNAIGKHIADLWAAADTAGILLNFIMEERLMKDEKPEDLRAEVEKYVEKKKDQLQKLREAAVAQVGATDEPSNG
jgi:hypothetical protein